MLHHCSGCLRTISSGEVAEEVGGWIVCIECAHPPTDDALTDAIPYKDNPGAVPGIDTFTIQSQEAMEALALNEHVKALVRIMYENAPPRSVAAIAKDASLKILDAISARIKDTLLPLDPHIRVAPLIVVDGAIDEGGKEATAYLQIMNIVHDRYISLHRAFLYTVRGSKDEERRAEEHSHRMLWHIGSLIRSGTMGARLSIEEIRKRGRFWKTKS